MEQSAKDKSKKNGGVKSADWKDAKNDREAFKDEAKRIKADGGIGNKNNLNQRNSPGKRYLKEDGG